MSLLLSSSIIAAINASYKTRNLVVVHQRARRFDPLLASLQELAAIREYRIVVSEAASFYRIQLNYVDGLPAIKKITVNSSGFRASYRFADFREALRFDSDRFVVSTSRGIMTMRAAVELGVGGIIVASVLY